MTIEDIKKLRDATGAGIMDAKQALKETDGDHEKAIDYLRKKGVAKAAKRAEREAKEGLIEAYLHGGKIGVLVEVNCETDFVAKTDDFKQFAKDVAMHVAALNPAYLTPDDVPADVLEREKGVFAEETKGKPADVAEKIIEGKLNKFYEQVCLVKQPFVKDGDKTIESLMTELISKLGENIVVRQMSRIELGG